MPLTESGARRFACKSWKSVQLTIHFCLQEEAQIMCSSWPVNIGKSRRVFGFLVSEARRPGARGVWPGVSHTAESAQLL